MRAGEDLNSAARNPFCKCRSERAEYPDQSQARTGDITTKDADSTEATYSKLHSCGLFEFYFQTHILHEIWRCLLTAERSWMSIICFRTDSVPAENGRCVAIPKAVILKWRGFELD